MQYINIQSSYCLLNEDMAIQVRSIIHYDEDLFALYNEINFVLLSCLSFAPFAKLRYTFVIIK